MAKYAFFLSFSRFEECCAANRGRLYYVYAKLYKSAMVQLFVVFRMLQCFKVCDLHPNWCDWAMARALYVQLQQKIFCNIQLNVVLLRNHWWYITGLFLDLYFIPTVLSLLGLFGDIRISSPVLIINATIFCHYWPCRARSIPRLWISMLIILSWHPQRRFCQC